MKFNAKTRQRIVDEYLNATGQNAFRPASFVAWLADKPEHPAYRAFFALTNEDAASAYRINLARQFVSGLRITVTTETVDSDDRTIRVETTFPAMFSPMGGRRSGGGYVPFVSDDADAMEELQTQAGIALRAWAARYSGCAGAAGADLAGIRATVALLCRETALATT